MAIDFTSSPRQQEALALFTPPAALRPVASLECASVVTQLTIRRHKVYSIHEKRIIVALRFGSLTDFSKIQMSFSQVAAVLHMPKASVQTILSRFKRQGYVVKPPGYKMQPKHVLLRKLSPELMTQLTQKELLQKWAHLSLQERCHHIQRQFQVNVSPCTLMKWYKKSGLRYVTSGVKHRQKSRAQLIHQGRFDFAWKLAGLRLSKAPMIWFDETSLDLWTVKKKTWMGQQEAFNILTSPTMQKKITIYGSIGTGLKEPLFMVAGSTRKENYLPYVKRLAKLVGRAKHQQPVHFVLDNHGSHFNKEARAVLESNGVKLLFLPSHSSEFNCIEYLWASLKSRIRKKLTQSMGKFQLPNLIHVIHQECQPSKVDQERYFHANRKFILKQLQASLEESGQGRYSPPKVEVFEDLDAGEAAQEEVLSQKRFNDKRVRLCDVPHVVDQFLVDFVGSSPSSSSLSSC